MPSSRFAKSRRIQPLPLVCKAPIPDIQLWKPPFSHTPLLAYARWYQPGSPIGASLQHSFSLSPLPAGDWWQGTSTPATDQIQLTLQHHLPTNQWDLTIAILRMGYPLDQHTIPNTTMRCDDPIDTGLQQFVTPHAYLAIEARVTL